MTEHSNSPDEPRPSDDAGSPPERPAGRSAEPERSAPALAPSILDLVAARTGQSARVHLPDEGSAGATSPLIDVSAVSGVMGASSVAAGALPTGRGNYQVLGEIARGGMGAIYKSHDTDLGRDVAMKVLLEQHADNEAILQRFVEEAQIGGQLQHPGIVPVYEMGLMANDRPYFTMKLVKGRTLAKLMSVRKNAADERRRFLGIFEKVCETLAYAHARNVIHRDLKPANIMVGAFGEVQVVDWGLAKVLQEGGVADERPLQATQVSIIETVRSGSSGSGAESLAGSVLGTPSYMPPEQAQGRIDQVDERADVFGLGAILCEILTGQPPYMGKQGNVLVEASKALQDDALERLAACGADAELVELVTECIAPARSARPVDAAAVLERVQTCLATQEQRAREAELAAAQAEVRVTQERKARRLTLALAATIVAAVVVGGLGYLSVARADAERRDQTARQVDGLLEEAGVARERGDYEAALAACARADVALAAGDGDAELTSRIARAVERAEAGVEGVRREQQRMARAAAFVSELDDIAFGTGSEWTSSIAEAWRCGLFIDAFDEFGLDPLQGDLEASLAAIAETGQVTPIVFALDEWSRLTRKTKSWRHPEALRLSELAARLDDDPVRARIRVVIAQDDVSALGGLVRDSVGQDWPPTTVAMLYFAMTDIGLGSRAEEVLRACQRRYPTDYGINQLLAGVLVDEPTRDWPEIMRYASAAQAARSNNAVTTDLVCGILREMGRVDEALETYLAGIRANPDDLWLAGGLTLGQNLSPYTRGADRRAVRQRVHETFMAAAPLTPRRQRVAAWFLVGTSDPELRDSALAIELIEALLDDGWAELGEADPDDVAGMWRTLSVAQYQEGRSLKAISSFESALSLEDDGDADAVLVVALALEQLGEEEQARSWYELALGQRKRASERSSLFGELDYLWAEAAERFGK